MNTIILTSRLETYTKNKNGEKIPQYFGNKNGILSCLKKWVKKFKNFLFIPGTKDNYELNDAKFNITKQSFEITLPFKNYYMLDGRVKKEKCKSYVEKADFILISGGHVPTQNKFLHEYNLDTYLHKSKAVVLGISAGSMNLADIAYCPPEEQGEAIDSKFNRFLSGLGLAPFNIYPHYNKDNHDIVDNVDIFEKILVPDSYKLNIYAICDTSYIELSNQSAILHGEAYLYHNGHVKQICKDNEQIEL